MAALVDGCNYDLCSNINRNANKTFIHFKLTDSALRAIEKYSKIVKESNGKATIQFTDNSGVMCIPAPGSSDHPEAEASFMLDLADIHGEANGSFDCIQQIDTVNGSQLSQLGSMQYKISTRANNDVYGATKEKMAKVDTESKKVRAKEIKLGGKGRSGNVRRTTAFSNRLPGAGTKSCATVSRASPLSSSSAANGCHITSDRFGQPTRLSPSSSASHGTPRFGSTGAVSSQGQRHDAGRAAAQQTSRLASGPATKLYKDRVTHLLALRPYKKPELLARLMKDGIGDKEKGKLGEVLNAVAVLSKDNSYTLSSSGWQSVSSDWEHYSDGDRELLKRNRHQKDLKPLPSFPSVPHDNIPSRKKHAIDGSADTVLRKKQRPTRLAGGNGGGSGVVDGSGVSYGGGSLESPAVVTMPGSTKKLSLQSPAQDSFDVSPGSNCENQGCDEDSLTDYLTRYTLIVACDQRQRYKDDFNAMYQEYVHLHDKLRGVSTTFQLLKDRLMNTPEGSQEMEDLCCKVRWEYEQRKRDPQFQQRMDRMKGLHTKLRHIKSLIVEYDSSRHHKQCR